MDYIARPVVASDVESVYVTDTSQYHTEGTAAVYIGDELDIPGKQHHIFPNDPEPDLRMVQAYETLPHGYQTEKYVTDHPMIIQQKMSGGQDKPNDYKELSVIACLLNILLGMIALGFTMRSQKAWEAGNMKQAKRYGRCALFYGLVAILTVLAAIVLCCWFLIR